MGVEEMKLKIASLESDLSKAKQEVLDSDLKLTKLKESVKKNDKISHSSFNVGDVGLFMPTGELEDIREHTWRFTAVVHIDIYHPIVLKVPQITFWGGSCSKKNLQLDHKVPNRTHMGFIPGQGFGCNQWRR